MRGRMKLKMPDLQVCGQVPGRQQGAQRHPVVHPELTQNNFHVRFHCGLRDIQLLGDLAGRIAAADVRGDLLLSRREPLPAAQRPGLCVLLQRSLLEELRGHRFR